MVKYITDLTQTSIDVPEKNIELYEINDFETHDEIKLYKQRLTGSPYTPLLAYNGKVRSLIFFVIVRECSIAFMCRIKIRDDYTLKMQV